MYYIEYIWLKSDEMSCCTFKYRFDKYLCKLPFFLRFHPLACIVRAYQLVLYGWNRYDDQLLVFKLRVPNGSIISTHSTTHTLLKDQLTSFTHVLCSQSYTGEEAFDLFHFFSNGGSCSTLIFPTPLYLQHTHTKHTHKKQKKFDLSILASFIMVDLYLLKKIHLTSHFVAWPFACITERNGLISRRFFVSGKAWVTFSK